MQVSVIIPVYNAADFVTQAVESALQQPETAEVLLIEDGSPDKSLETCQQLAVKYDKVRLLHHQDGKNRGAGASRNLGMQNSSCEFIAFLDADDYYLSDRFLKAKRIFQKHPDCDGVYEAIGMHIENEIGRQRWKAAKRPENQLKTVTKIVDPEQLGEILVSGGYGHFSLNGFVFKKNVLSKSGYMDETLRLHQDTNFAIRVSIVARLFPGRLDEAVTMWRVHDHNRISAPRSAARKYKEKMMFWLALYHWCKEQSNFEMQRKILDAMIKDTKSYKYFNDFPIKLLPTRLVWGLRLLRLLQYPELIVDLLKWQN